MNLRTNYVLFGVALATASLICAAGTLAAAPNLLNYQGRLTTPGGAPVVDNTYAVTFSIYSVPSAGSALWTETQPVTTVGGIFSAVLGSTIPFAEGLFSDSTRYLGIKVGADPEISPRTRLISVPFALRVATVDGAAGGNISSKVSIGTGHINTGLNAFVAGASNEASGSHSSVGGGFSNSASGISSTIAGGQKDTASGSLSTVAGGSHNVASGDASTVAGGTNNNASGSWSTVGGGGGAISTDSNSAIGDYSTVAGGNSNRAAGAYATIGGGHTNRAIGFHSTVAGGDANTAQSDFSAVGGGTANTSNNTHATVGGGAFNTASGQYSSVLGGRGNLASGYHSTVGGGEADTASGDHSTVGGGHTNRAGGFHSTIAGGDANLANSDFSTVGGGTSNTCNHTHATVGGGAFNTASGQYSTVPGGYVNVASGRYSLAAGRRARAEHIGAFVWADSTNADFATTGTNQFLIRAAGGVGIGTNSPSAGLHVKGAGFPRAFGYFDTDASAQDAGLRFYEAGVTKSHVYHQASTNTLNLFGEGFSGISVNSTGNVGIGTASPTAKLHVVGNICYTGSIGACSDARYKTDVQTISGSLRKILKLRGVSYRWKKSGFSGQHFDDNLHLGFIAQELEQLFPEIIMTDSAGYKSVDYGRLTPVLVETIKEQQATIESLTARLERMEGVVNKLAAILNTSEAHSYGVK